MRKNSICSSLISAAITALVMGFVFVGCATTTVSIYDRSTPVSESSAISPAHTLTITHIDDKPFMLSGDALGERWLLIPSGAHTITLNFSEYRNNATYTANGLKATVSFEPGHYYRISDKHIDGQRITVMVFDDTDENRRGVEEVRRKVEAMR
ncbi:MAG: hypothetical protein LBB61_00870 [Treponema sp.]|jgi:hypothetical protein|nr:hypothetical protein [Treponema sp.]